jgi:SAM-dependent methyltransferase
VKSEWFRAFFDEEYVEQLRDQKRGQTGREAAFVFKALRLKPRSRVLDVGCGFGRHAAALARRGARVTGVDLSRAMLEAARRQTRGLPVTLLRADMRRMKFAREFDGAYCLFTSFGYFSPRQNLQALRGMARSLRPGGRLVIDTPDRAYLDRHSLTKNWSRSGPRYIFEEADYDRSSGRVRSRWHVLRLGSTRVRRRHTTLYVHDLAQWKGMFRRVGLSLAAACGGFDGRPPKAGETRRLIVIGERRA